ncbi:hypothetical protein EWM64_g6029 [Hericium alpestre]|uniref:Calcineurin-like phosphoesterase domain-containing protein n=1 Tax=Hericium alpestre TaxID=135208 RepID=A0A4Y9ZUR6_9AGAM|nr:hypothetical protein EWM64_g6029 [Hericium alpestre]
MDDRAKVQGRLARMLVPDVLVNGLRLFWATLVIWGEIGLFFFSLSDCRWPDRAFRSISKATPTHVLLIADPQLLPPLSTRTWTQVFRDIYLHKSWSAVRHLRPNAVLFLGDMLAAGGSYRDDEGYTAYVKKFKDTFTIDPRVELLLRLKDGISLGASNSFTKRVRHRYQAYFGSVNQHLSIANHSLVLLDAPAAVDEDYLRADEACHSRIGHLLKMGRLKVRTNPVILFSHIPLHRAESRKCGPLRETGTIRRGVGHGWQSTLGKQTSRFLLDSLHPVIVFSADDRDYCDITHTLHDNSSTSIHEITVKSFSPTRHITRSGLQLLSLLPTSDEIMSEANSTTPRHAHKSCLLPSLNSPLASLYMPFFFLSLLLLLISHYRRTRRSQPILHSPTLRLSPTPTTVSPIPPSPYSSSSTYSYGYAYSNKPPHSPGAPLIRTPSQTAYFDLPANNERSVIGAGGLRTPRTPWTPWTPQSPGMSVGPDDDVEAEGGGHGSGRWDPAEGPRPGGPLVLVAGTPMKAKVHQGSGPRDGRGGDGGGGGGDSSDGESLFAS